MYILCNLFLVCQGTMNGLSFTGDENYRYRILKSRYENCTHVDGNLEISYLYNSSHDLSFLESIQEVSGYVLIVSNFMNYIPLTNLKLIRGNERFSFTHEGYSLFVALNFRPNSTSTSDGLLQLGFRSLSGKMFCLQLMVQ